MKPVNNKDAGSFLRYQFIPGFFMLTCPFWNLTLWMLCNLEYSLADYAADPLLYLEVMPKPSWPALGFIAVFFAFEGVLLKYLPGKKFTGPVSEAGEVPVYKDNALSALFVTWLVYFGLAGAGYYNAGVLWDHYGEGIATMNVVAYVLTLALYVKGRLAPTCLDCNPSQHGILFDIYSGIELYPKFLGLPLKQWINCRTAMMLWALVTPVFAAKQYELFGTLSSSMAVSTVLVGLYNIRFQYWEKSYMSSIDIMVDRCGFYLQWGILCFVPGLYPTASLWLVSNPIEMPLWYSGAVLALGFAALITLHIADEQRQVLRRTGGRCLIFGCKPDFIRAKYRTLDGEERESLLLCSGFWGPYWARHAHYLFEWTFTYCWCVLAAGVLPLSWVPMAYPVFLAVLLFDRSFRDDVRCSQKYGKYWDEYKRRVPAQVIPFIF